MYSQLDGALVIDKPAGPTSAKVVADIKKLTRAKKVGHTGTLDPFATGVLVCCLNQSTRLAHFLLQEKKAYEAVLHLGVQTDTQDATGQVTAEGRLPLDALDRLEPIFAGFVGEIQQQPPAFSALKHNGRPLYEFARKGIAIQKPARSVTIYQLRILKTALPEIHFEVACSAGTYIRTLCADIGRELGCGGHLKQLRRISSSGFSVADALTVESVAQHCKEDTLAGHLVPMTQMIDGIPRFTADQALIRTLMHGRPVTTEQVPADAVAPINAPWPDHVQVVDQHQGLLAILQYRKDPGRYDYCCVFPNGNAK